MRPARPTIALLLSLFLAVLFSAATRAETSIVFSSVSVQPGEAFSVDVILENDVVIGSAFVPFRWSTSDIEIVSIDSDETRYTGFLEFFPSGVFKAERRSGFIVRPGFTPETNGWIEPGQGPIARLQFRVVASAPDQIAFVDSAMIKSDTLVVLQTSLSDFNGMVILPEVRPGAITIGNPTIPSLVVSPASVVLSGRLEGNDPSAFLSVTSDGSTDLDWTANWGSNWLSVSPSLGKTPGFPTVSANLFGLDTGDYVDTVSITSLSFDSPPVAIPVFLHVDTAAPPVSLGFSLLQNRPNPFVAYSDPETDIRYHLDEPAHVEIAIFNTLGRKVRSLLSRNDRAGDYSVTWDGRDSGGRQVASGHYFYRMTTERGTITRRMILIK